LAWTLNSKEDNTDSPKSLNKNLVQIKDDGGNYIKVATDKYVEFLHDKIKRQDDQIRSQYQAINYAGRKIQELEDKIKKIESSIGFLVGRY
jgi:prefoldin subunit 5